MVCSYKRFVSATLVAGGLGLAQTSALAGSLREHPPSLATCTNFYQKFDGQMHQTVLNQNNKALPLDYGMRSIAAAEIAKALKQGGDLFKPVDFGDPSREQQKEYGNICDKAFGFEPISNFLFLSKPDNLLCTAAFTAQARNYAWRNDVEGQQKMQRHINKSLAGFARVGLSDAVIENVMVSVQAEFDRRYTGKTLQNPYGKLTGAYDLSAFTQDCLKSYPEQEQPESAAIKAEEKASAERIAALRKPQVCTGLETLLTTTPTTALAAPSDIETLLEGEGNRCTVASVKGESGAKAAMFRCASMPLKLSNSAYFNGTKHGDAKFMRDLDRFDFGLCPSLAGWTKVAIDGVGSNWGVIGNRWTSPDGQSSAAWVKTRSQACGEAKCEVNYRDEIWAGKTKVVTSVKFVPFD